MDSSSMCRPINAVDEVLRWNSSEKRNFKTKSLILNSNSSQNNKDKDKLKMLICHDMCGGYLEDKYYQGCDKHVSYRFYDWYLIDCFIYFSHYFITIPTESWINAAHNNNTPILGTFITEWQSGYTICNTQLFISNEFVDKFVEKLVEITLFYDFDGWLINIENQIKPEYIQNIVYFLQSLTQSLKSIDNQRYKVIWYDSILSTGQLKWQNELNNNNECFFTTSSAFFTNYTWKIDNLNNTALNSKNRSNDVYVGVDVFGRNCYGGGGWNCDLAFDKIAKYKLNVALFAPGWTFETNDKLKFNENSIKFWSKLDSYVLKQVTTHLPIICTFNQGCGNRFYVNGQPIDVYNKDDTGVYNLNLQTLMPLISSYGDFETKYERYPLNWSFDDAYYGTNCIEYKSDLENLNLFNLNIHLRSHQVIRIKYVFKLVKEFSDIPVDEFNNVYLGLSYIGDDNELRYYDLVNLNTSVSHADFKFIDYQQTINTYQWISREFIFSVVNSELLYLKNLYLTNKNGFAVKFGFLSIVDLNLQIDVKNPVNVGSLKLKNNCCTISNIKLLKSKCLRLDHKYYYYAEIGWNFKSEYATDGENDYFNIFLKMNTQDKTDNLSDEEYKYIGTTRITKYYICLELNNYDFSFYKSSTTSPSPSSYNNTFTILVQYVNNLCELVDLSFEQSIIQIEIPARATIARIVYDFEDIFELT